jgi:hypothetical protein
VRNLWLRLLGPCHLGQGKALLVLLVHNEQARAGRRDPSARCALRAAEWLEETVWADVRRFLKDPGEVLERVQEQLDRCTE